MCLLCRSPHFVSHCILVTTCNVTHSVSTPALKRPPRAIEGLFVAGIWKVIKLYIIYIRKLFVGGNGRVRQGRGCIACPAGRFSRSTHQAMPSSTGKGSRLVELPTSSLKNWTRPSPDLIKIIRLRSAPSFRFAQSEATQNMNPGPLPTPPMDSKLLPYSTKFLNPSREQRMSLDRLQDGSVVMLKNK